jgi:type IV pilus assembly protein PilW
MIELMISVTIGLFMVGAIGYLYLTSRGAYRSNAALSRVQEDGRFGLDALMHDARAVGDLGCSSTATVNGAGPLVLPGDNITGTLVFSGPATELFGTDASSYQFPAPGTTITNPFNQAALAAGAPAWIAGDVVQMVIPTSKPVSLTADVLAATTSATLADNSARLRQKDVLLLANCANAGLVTVTATPATGAGAVPVAISANLVPPTAVPQLTVPSHASALRLDAVTYYVGQFPGRPWSALYRYSSTYGVAEEVVDHVENMSVRYGVGANPPDTAANITAAGKWDQVTSLRVSLQVVGDEQGSGATNTPVSLVPGTAILAPDSRLRQIFTATAAVRNRLP